MKLALAFFFLALNARAETITCIHEKGDVAAQKVADSIQDGLKAFLKAKTISLNGATIDGQITLISDSAQYAGGPYETFQLSYESAYTTDGTPLVLTLSGDAGANSWDTQVALYHPVLKSNGFDKEGNPIDGQCTLTLIPESPNYSDVANTVTVTNGNSGHVLGSFPLAKTITVY